MKIVGIDYSITGPGICLFEGKRFALGNCTFHFWTDKKTLHQKFKHKNFTAYGHPIPKVWENDIHRFDLLSTHVFDVIKVFKPDLTAIEGYSYGSSAGRAFDIAENAGILKYKLYKSKFKFPMVYAPTEVKKFASGKGNASKILMRDSFVEETGIDINDVLGMKTRKPTNPVSDIIDAYFITKLMFEDKDDLIQ